MHKKRKVIGIIAIIMAVVLFISAGICFFIYKWEMGKYEADEQKVRDIAQEVVDDSTKPTIAKDDYVASNIADSEDDDSYSYYDGDYDDYDDYGGQYDTDDDDWMYDPDYYLKRKIDFAYLQSINKDATCWLTIPGTNVDYYVMQEPVVGQTFYLWRDIYKNSSSWGSLLSPAVPGGGSSAHTLIFGHHMINGYVGFSSFSSYYYSDAYNARSFRDVYVYYPDHSERWKVYAACDGYSTDNVYNIPTTVGSDNYASLLSNIKAKSRYTLGKDPDKDTKTLVLSTCNGFYAGSNVRFYVVCVPDVQYSYSSKKITKF